MGGTGLELAVNRWRNEHPEAQIELSDELLYSSGVSGSDI